MTDNSNMSENDRYSLAIRAYEAGNYETAIEHYSALAAEFPGDAEYYIGLAISFVEAGHYQAAELPFTMALELNPDDDETHHNYGRLLLHKLGYTHKALPHLRRAVELNSKGVEYQLDLGFCWQRCNQEQYASRAFQAEIDNSGAEGLMAFEPETIRHAVSHLNTAWQATFHARDAAAEIALLSDVFDQASLIRTPTCTDLADQCRTRLDLFKDAYVYPVGAHVQPMRLIIT